MPPSLAHGRDRSSLLNRVVTKTWTWGGGNIPFVVLPLLLHHLEWDPLGIEHGSFSILCTYFLLTYHAGQLAGGVPGAVLEVDVGAGGDEDGDALPELLVAGDVQRRPTVVVRRVHVRAAGQQRRHELGAVLRRDPGMLRE